MGSRLNHSGVYKQKGFRYLELTCLQPWRSETWCGLRVVITTRQDSPGGFHQEHLKPKFPPTGTSGLDSALPRFRRSLEPSGVTLVRYTKRAAKCSQIRRDHDVPKNRCLGFCSVRDPGIAILPQSHLIEHAGRFFRGILYSLQGTPPFATPPHTPERGWARSPPAAATDEPSRSFRRRSCPVVDDL